MICGTEALLGEPATCNHLGLDTVAACARCREIGLGTVARVTIAEYVYRDGAGYNFVFVCIDALDQCRYLVVIVLIAIVKAV